MNSTAMLVLIPLAIVAIIGVVVPRVRMERRAKLLLAAMPDYEAMTVYLSFPTPWPRVKRALLKSKIEEEARSGWTFLRAGEASPLRSFRSFGGGITLYFIRKRKANQAPEPTTLLVMSRADARATPSRVVAHL